MHDCRKWGLRGKATLRSEGDPAIVDLYEDISNASRAVTKGRFAANGPAERAVQKFKKRARVIELATDDIFGVESQVGMPVFAWLVSMQQMSLTSAIYSESGLPRTTGCHATPDSNTHGSTRRDHQRRS